MPASSTNTTVRGDHPCRPASILARIAATVDADVTTPSPVITSAALPVGAKPTTSRPCAAYNCCNDANENVLPDPAGATNGVTRASLRAIVVTACR